MKRIRMVGGSALILLAAGAGLACGGRTQLVPLYQIGRLSAGAVVANHSGVRVMARTTAWPGPPLDEIGLLPLEITFDNETSRVVEVRRQHIALLTAGGQRVSPLDPAMMTSAGPALQSIRQHAIVEGAVMPGGRLAGFVYFPEPNADALDLHVDLISAPMGERFGEIVIPFALD
jgi:hypothetical protein